MASAFTYKRASNKYACGTDLTNITVVNFAGPDGAKLSAYSCNMNIDLDGDVQAYAPFSKPALNPMDNLGNAGWKDAGKNATLKATYEAGKLALADLEKKRAELLKPKAAAAGAGATPVVKTVPVPAPVPAPTVAKPLAGAKPAVDPAVAALDKQIAAKKQELRKISYENTDEKGDYTSKNPKNLGKIFWKWYGVAALTPEQAKSYSYLELEAPKLTIRKPILDTTSAYEDVFGRFPVVQSVFEPGTDYFVSVLPPRSGVNRRYPEWDQRHFLPTDHWAQTPFAALTVPLASDTGLSLLDKVFAVRLDTSDTLTFPFRDAGYDYKVAECSFGAFGGLGGDYHPERSGAAKFPNNFLVLYLAFPKKQNPPNVLAKFATASNASDFPVLLSFMAQAAVDAKAKGSKVIKDDPVTAFEAWKKKPSSPLPASYTVVNQSLSSASGSDFVERMMKTHGSLLKGPQLTPPTMP